MKTEQDYFDKVLLLEESGLGKYVDPCVDAENALPLTYGDNLFWNEMCVNLIDSVGMRAAENGIDINDFGFRY